MGRRAVIASRTASIKADAEAPWPTIAQRIAS